MQPWRLADRSLEKLFVDSTRLCPPGGVNTAEWFQAILLGLSIAFQALFSTAVQCVYTRCWESASRLYCTGAAPPNAAGLLVTMYTAVAAKGVCS